MSAPSNAKKHSSERAHREQEPDLPLSRLRSGLSQLRSVDGFWYRPVDGAWLGAFRILFGSLMVISMIRFLAYGWVQRFFVEPRFHFKFWGFSWVEPLPEPGMTGLFYALVVLAACMAAGLWFRVTASLFTVGLFYFQLIDVSTYLNHYYLAALLSLLLTLSPAGRVWSLDAWWARRRATKQPPTADATPSDDRGEASHSGQQGAPRSRIPALWLYLFRAQVGTVYFFAGLAKLNSDWLLHAQPLRIWLGNDTHLPLLGPLFTIEGVPLLMSWAGFLFDLTIVLWLSLRKTRKVAYLVVIAFHTMTRILFPIGMFPFIMTGAALVFFEPTWPRDAWGRVQSWYFRFRGHPAPRPRISASSGPAAPWMTMPRFRKQLAVFAVISYCSVQFLFPLRFLLYGGNVMWHEQGMRFAWRVMLRAKGGSASFLVRDRNSGREVIVDPRQYLTDLQEAEMVSRPDLILQMAHHVRRDYEQRGFENVEVRVDSQVTLNGRRSARLIDPSVNLAVHQDGLQRPDWVTDAPSEPPHHTRPVL